MTNSPLNSSPENAKAAGKVKPQFGDIVVIEMKRFGVPNEFYTHKVIGQLRCNVFVDVPVQSPPTETLHAGEMADAVRCVVEGIDETVVRKYRVSDVRIVRRNSHDALIALRDELVRALEGVSDWLQSSLDCASHPWDGDQREAAVGCMQDAVAALNAHRARLHKSCADKEGGV